MTDNDMINFESDMDDEYAVYASHAESSAVPEPSSGIYFSEETSPDDCRNWPVKTLESPASCNYNYYYYYYSYYRI